MEKAMFGAGCFWGVEAAFRQVKGVQSTAVGYSGGHLDNPTYKDVCSGRTGHAEVVEVDYDPAQVSYDDLLNVFWDNHDPTTMNRQGPDVGAQYRSAIFFHGPEQEAAAKLPRKRRRAVSRTRSSPRSRQRRNSIALKITISSIWRSAAWRIARSARSGGNRQGTQS